MKLLQALLLLVLSTKDVSAFQTPSIITKRAVTRLNTELYSEKKPLTSADILARARDAIGAPKEEEGPKMEFPFEPSLLDDFERILKIMEKRVQSGPGSLGPEETNEFKAISQRIIIEMDEVNELRAYQGGSGAEVTRQPAARARVAETTAVEAPPPAPEATSVLDSGGVEHNDEDGPEYDGTGGFGLAKGTANTYIIDGMDEMDAEEYRAALQKSVIDRQEDRRRSMDGRIGNRAAHNYLDALGYGGTASRLSGNDMKEDKDDE